MQQEGFACGARRCILGARKTLEGMSRRAAAWQAGFGRHVIGSISVEEIK
jgi:hypothetical protein